MMDNLREKLMSMSPEEFRAAARERELEEWRGINRFCGKCGSPMQPHANAAERAMVCPKCGYMAYPKLSPAVIVLVTKGNKILLQRNTHYKLRNWTLVAGFVDAGENFEDAVRREVMEEASIEVGVLRYFGSQTWPFPSNIMIGFRAEYASGELTPDGEEVVESGWFDRDNLPEIPHKGSIARAMIDAWLEEQDDAQRDS
jgi:NAD+ diphosphatase